MGSAVLCLSPAARAATGALTQLAGNEGCVVDTGDNNTQCAAARALDAPDFVSSDNRNVYVSSQRPTFTANQAPPAQRTVTVSLAGSGSGSVSGSGISCPGACSHTYIGGTIVTLSATPAAGSSFTGFSGSGCSGTGACTVTVTADRAITATFAKPPPHNPPVVKITKTKINQKKHQASFSFSAPGATSYQCALTKRAAKHHKQPKPHFSTCRSPHTYKNLTAGHYTFMVRAHNRNGTGPTTTRSLAIK